MALVLVLVLCRLLVAVVVLVTCIAVHPKANLLSVWQPNAQGSMRLQGFENIRA